MELIQHQEDAIEKARQMTDIAQSATAESDKKRNLLATVAHEMRNPLTPIR